MNTKNVIIMLVAALMLVSSVSAAGLSMQLKRTNPGIAQEKAAELIFDAVNTDFNHKIEGFVWCRSPDDTTVTSSLGISSGSGAQYVSEKFFMDVGPSQKAIALTIEANSPGDKRTGCTIKYAPYSEIRSDEKTTIEEINYDGTIGFSETVVSGYKIKLLEGLTEETSDNSTKSVMVSVNGIPKEVMEGSSQTIGGLTVELIAVRDLSADVVITGTISSTSGGSVRKQYVKMNAEEVATLTNDQYREIRLDKTVPFVAAEKDSDVTCPQGKISCKASEVVVVGGKNIPVLWIVIGVVGLLLVVAWLMGKVSRE